MFVERGLEIQSGKVFWKRMETHHKRTSAPEKSDVLFLRLHFPVLPQVNPPVGALEGDCKAGEGRRDFLAPFPFQRVPCLFAAPAGILGIHLHTFNSTSFSEQQLRPICSFPFAAKPLHLSHSPFRISSINRAESFTWGHRSQSHRAPALS